MADSSENYPNRPKVPITHMDRHNQKSTIITNQLPVANWFDIMGEVTIADSILDQLVHTSHRIELKGKSLRKTHNKIVVNLRSYKKCVTFALKWH